MATLQDALQKSSLAYIEKLTPFHISFKNNVETDALSYLFRKKILTEAMIEEALDTAVRASAKEMYKTVAKKESALLGKNGLLSTFAGYFKTDGQKQEDAFAEAKRRLFDPSYPRPIFPDHVQDSRWFAYGIAYGALSDKEIEAIAFDHGQTPSSFIAEYSPNMLLPDLRKQLLTKKPKLKFSSVDSLCCH